MGHQVIHDGDTLELEGEESQVKRAEHILADYADLVREGHAFNNGDLNSYMRVCTADPGVSLRRLVESGKSRSFGKKVLAPKSVNQRRYIDAIEHHDLIFGIGPAGTGAEGRAERRLNVQDRFPSVDRLIVVDV